MSPKDLESPGVTHEVPKALGPPSEAALAWVNATRGTQFKITGLVDADAALADLGNDSFELGLILCQDDVCAREQVVVERLADGFRIKPGRVDDPVIPPTLDPPAGARSGWLDAQLAKHAFVVLVFYRGFW